MHNTTVLETAARAGIGLERIDVVIDESLRLLGRGLYGYTYSELAPAATVEIEGERIRVATVDQIRAMKTGTGRLKDIVDLEELDELQ